PPRLRPPGAHEPRQGIPVPRRLRGGRARRGEARAGRNVGLIDAGADLAAIVGPSHVAAGDAAAAFAIDRRGPRGVVSPCTAEEVGRCLAVATAHGLGVAPTGRGTRLGWGGPPRVLDLVLSLRRLDRIVAHEPADLTIAVEAGVTLGAIAA